MQKIKCLNPFEIIFASCLTQFQVFKSGKYKRNCQIESLKLVFSDESLANKITYKLTWIDQQIGLDSFRDVTVFRFNLCEFLLFKTHSLSQNE